MGMVKSYESVDKRVFTWIMLMGFLNFSIMSLAEESSVYNLFILMWHVDRATILIYVLMLGFGFELDRFDSNP